MIGGDQWSNPWQLETPMGTIKFNQTDPATGRRFQFNPAKCSATLPVRSTEDDVPQGDGKIPHRRWRSGYGVHLAIEPLIAPAGADANLVEPYGEAKVACDADLVEMLDLLGLHLNAMIRTGLVSGLPNAKLIWTPDGVSLDDRMFDRCQLAAGGITTNQEGELGGAQVEVDLDTPFPYYVEKTETQTMLGGTGPEVVENLGNTDSFCVVEAYGDTDYFELINHSVVDLASNPLRVVYNDALPGGAEIMAGDFVELTFFDGKVYLNGNQAKRMAGIDMRVSDFFPLVPGENILEAIGAAMLVKSNGAFA